MHGGARRTWNTKSESFEDIRPILQRYKRTHTDNTSGSGLGSMYLAKWIAESHGGAIEALSGSGLEEKGD